MLFFKSKPTSSKESCTCKNCRDMCMVPCWPTPDEAIILIKNYPGRLRIEEWDDDIKVVAPRADKRCTFQISDGKCELHGLGMKPYEGREAYCQTVLPVLSAASLREEVAKKWNSQNGRDVIRHFKKQRSELD